MENTAKNRRPSRGRPARAMSLPALVLLLSLGARTSAGTALKFHSEAPCISNLRVDCWPAKFKSTALDDYVRRPDPHYKYEYMAQRKEEGYTVHFLNMTSQKWLNESVVSASIWWHIVSVIVPDRVDYKDSAFVWVEGGSNTRRVPGPGDQHLKIVSTLAVGSRSVAAMIQQIPNQPVVFKDDPSQERRKEDALLAWAWEEFLHKGHGVGVLPRLPMVKAVVRAMDSVTHYINRITGNTLDKFMVSGASKRGWTSWLAAAVDKRVVAMVPVVMDLLNMKKSLHHHYRSLGGWSLAFRDYYKLNVTAELDNSTFTTLMEVEDPLSYKDRLTMPKLMITATGDEFFLLDDSYYFFNQMKGPTYIRMVPNADHTMIGHRNSALNSILAFWLSILNHDPLPRLKWKLSQKASGDGRITLMVSRKPSDVTVYHARTVAPGRRDFRYIIMGPKGAPRFNPVMWHSAKPKTIGPLIYSAELKKPEEGYYAAFLIQVSFDGPLNSTLQFTTEANILPNTFPFPDCHGAACRGKLV